MTPQERREKLAEKLDDTADAINALHLGDISHADDGDLRGLRDGLRSWAATLHKEADADE